MNSGAHEKVASKLTVSTLRMRLLSLLFALGFLVYGGIPLYPGLTVVGGLMCDALLKKISPNSYASQNFTSVLMSTAPL